MYTLTAMTLSKDSGSITGTAEQIAARLRNEIEEGVLGPGTPLNQVALATRFGLSRIPVREALMHLAAEGYLTYRPNKGAIVAGTLSREETLEIIEIRECLEGRLMKHAVPRLAPEILRRAEASLKALNQAAASEVPGAHSRFHTILFEAAERPRMADIINGWRFRLDPRPDVDGRRKRTFALATRDVHRRLMDACGRADARTVRRCVAEEYEIIRSAVSRADAR
jgi:DNA-binding GntR family transcriptional regulator